MAHTYQEAFRVMRYVDDAGNVERIWNSRDGITPFIVRSMAGLEAQHKDWQLDAYEPFHVPQIGDRIFVNLTLEAAKAYRSKFVEEYWEADAYPMSKQWGTKEEAIEDLAQSDYKEFGEGTSPDLIVVTPEIQRPFVERANARLVEYPTPSRLTPRRFA